MSRERIKEVAINHFNHCGYKGTSLTGIAEEVGIRKQSLAYHFPNKCELFQEIYKEVVDKEINFVERYFEQYKKNPPEEQLYEFLSQHKERFLTDHHTALMLTTSVHMPEEVPRDILNEPHRYIEVLTKRLESCFAKGTFRFSPRECALAFATLIDGMNIQLIYEGVERYEKIQKVTWDIFWKGIQMQDTL